AGRRAPAPVRGRRGARAAAERGGVLTGDPPLAVICWPFDQGRPDHAMGAGASLLASDLGLHDALAGAGWSPTLERVAAADPSLGEVARTFELLRAHAVAV